MGTQDTLYSKLKNAGVELDHHESDMYVRLTPEALRILNDEGAKFTTFHSNKGKRNELWADVPFAYMPYWEAKEPAPTLDNT